MAQTKKRGPGRPPGSKNKNTSKSKKAQTTTKTKEEHIEQLRMDYEKDKRTIDVIWSVSLIALGIFFLCTVVRKSTGAAGVKIHDICLGLFGIMAYVLPFILILSGVLLIMRKLQHINLRTSICSALIYIQLCILNSYRFIDESELAYGFADIVKYYKLGVDGEQAGAVGMELGSLVVKFIGKSGLIISAIAILAICIFLVADTPISKFFETMSYKRESRRLLSELEEAEKTKVQQAVASVSSGEPIYSGIREENMKDTLVMPSEHIAVDPGPIKKNTGIFSKLRNTAIGSSNSNTDNSGLYDAEPVGNSSFSSASVKRTGYGLGGSDDFGNSGSYGLAPDDSYSTAASRGLGLADDSVKAAAKTAPAKTSRRIINAGIPESSATDDSTPYVKATDASVDTVPEIVPVAATKKSSRAAKAVSDEDTEKLSNDLNVAFSTTGEDTDYVFPPVNLLKKGSTSTNYKTEIQLEEKANLLEQTLRDFGVEASVLNVTQGSSVTRYEVQPSTGVKVSSITKLADDIALNLRAKSIRIEAPIPGKAAVGIEVENDKPSPVVIRDLIESHEFINAESKISFVVGKDISGRNVIADLKSMPHLLIAGATGSGKSVCINTIIASFLYKAKPSELKLIMIDPKVVELQAYNDIPHMLIPVVTEPKKASKALAIAVQEMDKRYEAFAKYGVKDLESYNDYMRAEQEFANVKPQIVIIIDELADLMMACSNEVENSICRLAQKARAAGMHLIVATQRPSVDVVTGLIKANIPSRIAFSVSSSVDSRTILDMAGAEKLLGKGDMLFSPVGSNKPYRVQGPFITENESAKLIKFVKEHYGAVKYDTSVQEAIDSTGDKSGNSGYDSMEDDLTEDAIAFILKSNQASVSMLQRRFRIGYNRAARIIDEIEAKGIIGPPDGSRPRKVLTTEEEYYGSGDDSYEEPHSADSADMDEVDNHTGEEFVEDVVYEPINDNTGVVAFDSLPESVQKEILSSDD